MSDHYSSKPLYLDNQFDFDEMFCLLKNIQLLNYFIKVHRWNQKPLIVLMYEHEFISI